MFTGIDHIVVAVQDLETAIREFGAAGFTVVRGGRHNIGTHNALIAFADGSYIELIAFLTPIPAHPWYRALERGGGLVDFCMRTTDLGRDAEVMRRAGASIGDAAAMTRDRPDGYRLVWKLAIPQAPMNGQLPFLIEDQTPRDERVPRERSHPNGAIGIARVTLAVENPGTTSAAYARVLGRPGAPANRTDLDAFGVRFTIGENEIELVAPKSSSGPIRDWIDSRGASPFAARLLLTGGAGTSESRLLERARLTFA